MIDHDYTGMRDLVRYLLENRNRVPLEDWTVQGFGFLRLKINDTLRMHVWDSSLRVAGVSDIHDHTQWAFTSIVFSGRIVNVRFSKNPNGQRFSLGTIKCGIGGGMTVGGDASEIRLLPGVPEIYLPGSSYHQEPDEIHQSLPADGTVTVIRQARRDTDTARVFWPHGSQWVDAVPRPAERYEVDRVAGFALSTFG